MMEILIGDLDGAISDDRWRRGHILPEPPEGRASEAWTDRFNEYHKRCYLDRYVSINHEFSPDLALVFLTARPVRYAELTREWLANTAKIAPLHVIHRNNNDTRSSVDVKREQMRWLLDPNMNYGVRRQQIVGAFDDREDIVKMYREEYGIPAMVIRIGSEEHRDG